MPITSMLNMAALRDLFSRAGRGDAEASQQVQSLGPRFSESVDVEADAPEVDLPGGGMVTSLGNYGQEAPEETGAPQTGTGPAISEGGGHDWGHLLRMASSGLSSLGSIVGGRVKADPGFVNKMSMERLQQDQLDALKKRHDMWSTAFEHSQQLPQEILTDPKFSSLAQAKAALDKDMLDGKIDNEKNVSGFLTELARHRTDLDDMMSQALGKRKGEQAVLAQEALVRAGLAETPQATREAKLAEDQAEREWRSREAALGRTSSERIAGLSGGFRRDALADRDKARSSAALGSMIEGSIGRYMKMGPEGEPINAREAMAQALEDNSEAIVEAARRAGVDFQAPGEGHSLDPASDTLFVIGGRTFDVSNPAEKAEALQLLYRLTRIQ